MAAPADIHNGSAGWHPFGLSDEDFEQTEERGGVKWVNVKLGGASPDRSGTWLRGAIAALAVLAAAAAMVSWQAQYVMVASVKHAVAVAAVEAGIPDVGAVIFAALGIALALHGKRAIRARALNVACVGISLAMNALAAARGWRDLAIWVMPSAVYAVASDTLIGVIRAWALAGKRDRGETLAEDDVTPLAIVGGAALWLLRLVLAPPPRWAASAPGSCRNALSPPAAKPVAPSPRQPTSRPCRRLATARTDTPPLRAPPTAAPRPRTPRRRPGHRDAAAASPASRTG